MILPDLALVITGHTERSLAHRTMRAVRRCLLVARDAGLTVEVIGVLDDADEETRRFFVENLGPAGLLQELCDGRTLEVSFADSGMSRMAGIRETRAPYVGVLDADNLPTSNWLVVALKMARDHGGPCVVHPEQLFIFEGRVELWPQVSSEDPITRVENFYDRSYWDTFCLASREVFEQHPYVGTPRGSGFGPEDWHWNTLTVQAGVPHIPALGTTLFYRVRMEGSVQSHHAASRSIIPRTPLLTDASRAAAVLDEARAGPVRRPKKRSWFLRRVIRGRPRDVVVPPPLAGGRSWFARLSRSFMWPDHYRFLYADLVDLSDAELVEHFHQIGRPEGRRGWLRATELGALAPRHFDVAHYRALYSDVVHRSDAEATLHYLETGWAAGRRAKLTRQEIQALRLLDLDDYQFAHPDVAGRSERYLVQHYLEYGMAEGRRPQLTDEERQQFERPVLDELFRSEARALHQIEPWIPLPDSLGAGDIRLIGPAPGGALTPGARVWWQIVDAFAGGAPDIIFFAPWLRLGGGDILTARYANAMARRHPDLRVAVVTTHGSSTHPEKLGEDITWVDFVSLPGFEDLTPDEQRYLIAMLVVQYAPRLVHAFNSPEFFDAVELFPNALAASSRLFLSTFVIDSGPHGEVSSHLTRRPAGYLTPVSGVIVDNQALVETFHDLYRFDRDKFVVHHQPIELPPRRPWSPREQGAPLKVLWAARFDRQKRLDVLADVVEAAARAGLAVDWHVYGAPVISDQADSEEQINRLQAAGATMHGVYQSFDELLRGDYDLFLLTSEAEGIPLTLLDVLAHRLPVMAPLVGGIPELVSEETGWPIERFDDVAAYVESLQKVAVDREECERRADAAYDLLAREFTWEAFDRRLTETPGYAP